jgi:hypothetical protein
MKKAGYRTLPSLRRGGLLRPLPVDDFRSTTSGRRLPVDDFPIDDFPIANMNGFRTLNGRHSPGR